MSRQLTAADYILTRCTSADWYSFIEGKRVYFEKVGGSTYLWYARIGKRYLRTPIVGTARMFSSLEKAVKATLEVVRAKNARDAALRTQTKGTRSGLAVKSRLSRRKQEKRRKASKRKRQVKTRTEAKVRKPAVKIILAKGVMRRVNTDWDF